MKTIIAGPRWIEDRRILKRALDGCPWSHEITEVVSGGALGVDTLGEMYARAKGLPIKRFPAAWRGADGTYNIRAGYVRNQQMVEYADALLAVWDGLSKGTGDVLERAEKSGLTVFTYLIPLDSL